MNFLKKAKRFFSEDARKEQDHAEKVNLLQTKLG